MKLSFSFDGCDGHDLRMECEITDDNGVNISDCDAYILADDWDRFLKTCATETNVTLKPFESRDISYLREYGYSTRLGEI